MSRGVEHWTKKGPVRLFLWEKTAGASPSAWAPSCSCTDPRWDQPTFDLQMPGRPEASAMDHFTALGYDTWCVDMEGYGRSDKHRDINSDIATGADDLEAAADYITQASGVESFLVYGISSGALAPRFFAQRHPERVRRLALDAFVWTGKAAPRWPTAGSGCPSSRAGTGARSTGPSCAASSPATIPDGATTT